MATRFLLLGFGIAVAGLTALQPARPAETESRPDAPVAAAVPDAPQERPWGRMEEMHPDELEEVLSAVPVAFVPLGTFEHHGWHLPVCFDGIKAHALCERVAQRTGGAVLPTFFYGTGGGHVGYKWTMILPEEQITPLIEATLDHLAAQGFKVVVVLTGHYAREQVAMVHRLAGEAEKRHPGVRFLGLTEPEVTTPEPGDRYGGDHAAKYETSIAMALNPKWARPDLLTPGRDPAATTLPATPRKEGSAFDPTDPLYAIYGQDPREKASKELGEKLVGEIVTRLAARVEQALARIPAPLFADPNYHGSCDPEIVWNAAAGEWWIFYTARRATRKHGTYVGTPIGVAASKDLVAWRFVGYCSFDGVKGRPDMPVTRWAPGILRQGDTYHMFVTFKDNADPPWGGNGQIVHYTAAADDLLDGWTKSDVADFAGANPIDATLAKADGRFRAYYRAGDGIQWAESDDMVHWTNRGECPGDVNDHQKNGLDYQEAPYVFSWRDSWWMLTDPHQGLAVYRSPDGVTWRFQGRILEAPGSRPEDHTRARHPSVAVFGDRALLFYHVEPNRPYPSPPAEKRTVEEKISFLQAAELELEDGRLVCNRDKPLLPPTVPAK